MSAINAYTHHAELVSDTTELLDSLLHSKELRTEDSTFNSGLLLTMALYHGDVHEYYETSSRPAVYKRGQGTC